MDQARLRPHPAPLPRKPFLRKVQRQRMLWFPLMEPLRPKELHPQKALCLRKPTWHRLRAQRPSMVLQQRPLAQRLQPPE